MTVPARLTAVTLGCRDLPAQRRFYRDLGIMPEPLALGLARMLGAP